MIRFFCEHCAHKISVRDKDVGKQGKCPKCGNAIVVPAESTVIDFFCKYCDKNISVPKSHAGKKAICPQCKNTFIIPTTQYQDPAANQNYDGDLIARTTDSYHGLTFLDVPEQYKLKEEPAVRSTITEEAIERRREYAEDSMAEEDSFTTQHKLPWFIDAFLYPISASGMVNLAVFVFLPVLVSFLLGILATLLNPFLREGTSYIMRFLTLPFYIVFGGYVCYYIAHCVLDSSKGNRRASDLPIANTFDAGDLIAQVILLLGCTAICFCPATFYYIFTKRTNYWFRVLLISGDFFFPMCILRGVLFDCFDALNPIEIFRSILSAFLPYCALVLFFIAAGELVIFILTSLPLWNFLETGIIYYLLFVLAHRLGWFYWWYKDKLGWGL